MSMDLLVAEFGEALLEIIANSAVVALLMFFRLLMGDGMEAFEGLPVFLFTGILFLRFRKPESRLIAVDTQIRFGDGEVSIVYPGIDREDGKGVRKEVYCYRAGRIRAIQYVGERKINIVGVVEFREEYANGEVRAVDGEIGRMDYIFVLYAQDEAERDMLAEKLRKSLCAPRVDGAGWEGDDV